MTNEEITKLVLYTNIVNNNGIFDTTDEFMNRRNWRTIVFSGQLSSLTPNHDGLVSFVKEIIIFHNMKEALLSMCKENSDRIIKKCLTFQKNSV